MSDPDTMWAWACIALGAWLAGYAVYSLKTGETRGYYQDHKHRSDDANSHFTPWVWFRLLLGVACLGMGVVFI